MRLIAPLFLLGYKLAVASAFLSYAAGDGAGSSRLLPHLDLGCARFSQAYPAQIANSSDLKITTFRNLACGGGLTYPVRATQVPRIGDSDMITIQVGGNEINFFELLNECVQQWLPFSKCERELVRARGLVESTSFVNCVDRLIQAAKHTAKPEAGILVLGSARFFSDNTEQCDHVSFSSKHPNNLLKREMWAKFNSIVLLLNDVVRGVAEAHGVVYVDVNRIFEGHRFCEDGVIEPSPDASWFFSDAGRVADRRVVQHDLGMQQQLLPNPLKMFLNFTQTFHPTSDGHTTIAREIISPLQK